VTRPKPKRRVTRLEPDRGTPELRQHHTLVEVGTRESRMGGRAEPHMRVVDQWPLDRYHHRDELAPGAPEGNEILWRSGDRLRVDWAVATGEPLKAARLERQDRGLEKAADRREDARRAFKAAMRAVGKLHTSVLMDDVAFGAGLGPQDSPAAAARPPSAEAGPGRSGAALPDAAGVGRGKGCQSSADWLDKRTISRNWQNRRE
jgi:hypothetical protein